MSAIIIVINVNQLLLFSLIRPFLVIVICIDGSLQRPNGICSTFIEVSNCNLHCSLWFQFSFYPNSSQMSYAIVTSTWCSLYLHIAWLNNKQSQFYSHNRRAQRGTNRIAIQNWLDFRGEFHFYHCLSTQNKSTTMFVFCLARLAVRHMFDA